MLDGDVTFHMANAQKQEQEQRQLADECACVCVRVCVCVCVWLWLCHSTGVIVIVPGCTMHHAPCKKLHVACGCGL